MKLHEVPRNTKIRVKGKIEVAPFSPPVFKGDILTFFHIDGLYSFCENQFATPVHLSALAEVEIVK